MSPEQGFLVMSYIGTAVQVVADWSCAITPFFIVWSLQMPRRAKISVVCVLGLGILASIAALMRIVSYKYIDTRYYPKDHMGKAVHYRRGPSIAVANIPYSCARPSCPLVSLRVWLRYHRVLAAAAEEARIRPHWPLLRTDDRSKPTLGA